MATEIAIFPLKEGKIPDDATSQAGQVLKDTLDTLMEQKGVQRAYWGREIENAKTFRLFVDWDTVDDHINFTVAEYEARNLRTYRHTDLVHISHYQPFLERFGQIADVSKAQLFHAHLTPHPATEALSDRVSPATEILTVYFPNDYSQADQDQFLEDIKKLVKAIEDNAETYTGSAGGWVEEEIPIPGTSDKGKAYIALIGWKSMEDHIAFRSHPALKENMHWLQEAKDIKHYSVVHYSGTEVQPGPGGVGDSSDMPSAQEEILNPQEGGRNPPKTASDGTTTKNNDALKGAANSLKKERAGR